MSYTIEAGIPMPTRKRRGSPRGPRTPLTKALASLEPSQSLLLTEFSEYESVRGLWCRMKPAQFISAKAEGGWRVWRTV